MDDSQQQLSQGGQLLPEYIGVAKSLGNPAVRSVIGNSFGNTCSRILASL